MRVLAALTAVLAALALAACGDDSTSTAPQITTAQGEEAGTTTSAGGEPGAKQSERSGGSGKAPGSGSSDTSGSANAAPLQVSGGGSTQFRVKGGDNSVQEFGQEGDESELEEAAEVVHGFYVARAGEEWARACSYMARSQIEELEQFVAQSPQLKGKGCAPSLAALTQSASATQKREITTIDAGSLRHEGEQAFLIYYGAGGTVFAMPMKREDGGWKVTALAGAELQQ